MWGWAGAFGQRSSAARISPAVQKICRSAYATIRRPPLSSSPWPSSPAYPVLQRVIPLVLQPLGPPALDGTVIAAHRPCDGRRALSLQHQLHHLLPLPLRLVRGLNGTARSVAAAKATIQANLLHFRSKACLYIQMFCICI